MAAAVADYRPRGAQRGQDQEGRPAARAAAPGREPGHPGRAGRAARPAGRGRQPVLVGFAAETDTSEQAARAKLARKGCDLLVVNPVGNGLGFGTPDNEAVVFGADGTVTPIPRGPKEALANVVWDLVVANLE